MVGPGTSVHGAGHSMEGPCCLPGPLPFPVSFASFGHDRSLSKETSCWEGNAFRKQGINPAPPIASP